MAQNNLGMAYAQGRGVARSAETAALWFRRAAERGGHRGMQDGGALGVGDQSAQLVASFTHTPKFIPSFWSFTPLELI